MVHRFKAMAEQALDEKRFQWTSKERGEIFAKLDEWVTNFNHDIDIRRQEEKAKKIDYQRDLARDKAKSSGGSGKTPADPNIMLNRQLDMIDQLIKRDEEQVYETVEGRKREIPANRLPANAEQVKAELKDLYGKRSGIARQLLQLGGGQVTGVGGEPTDTYVKYLTPPKPGDGRGWVAIGGVDIQKFLDFMQTTIGVPGPEVTKNARDRLADLKKTKPNMMASDAYRQIIDDLGYYYQVRPDVMENYL